MSVRQGKNYNYDIAAKALIYHDLGWSPQKFMVLQSEKKSAYSDPQQKKSTNNQYKRKILVKECLNGSFSIFLGIAMDCYNISCGGETRIVAGSPSGD